MNEKIFQKTFDEISPFLKDGWEKLVVYLEYGEASYSFSFFVKEDSKYIKCFDIDDIDEESLMLAFQRIDSFVSKARTKEKEPWSNMTMVVENDGSMHTDFDYTDLSKGNYKYKKAWKAKYLK